MALKNHTFRIEESDGDAFQRFIESNGYIKERAIAAAIRLFIESPPDVRQLAMAADTDGIRSRLDPMRGTLHPDAAATKALNEGTQLQFGGMGPQGVATLGPQPKQQPQKGHDKGRKIG